MSLLETTPSFRRLYLRLLDCCVATHNLAALKTLVSCPTTVAMVLYPTRYIPHTRFLSKLSLYYNVYEYKENVNEDFIKNSMLYLAIAVKAPVEVVRYLVELGCPLINERLEEGKHVSCT